MIYMALWLLGSGCAILIGGKSERLGAAVLLWINIGSLLLQTEPSARYMDAYFSGFAVDGTALIVCLFLAINSKKYWTLWFCAAQVVAVMGYLVHYMIADVAGLAYTIMVRSPSYIQCLVLLVGSIHHMRHDRQGD